MSNLSALTKQLKFTIENTKQSLKPISTFIDNQLEQNINKFIGVHADNEEIFMNRYSDIDQELSQITECFSNIETFADSIINSQKTISNELATIEKIYPRQKSVFSSDTLGSRQEIEAVLVEARVCNRYLSDCVKILSRSNPSKHYSIEENQEDILNDIEQKIVLYK